MTRPIRIGLTTAGLFLLGALLSLGPVHAQGQLTGQQILEKVDARGSIGSQISFSTFDIVDKSGTKRQNNFVFFGKNSDDPQTPNHILIYFLEPPKETCGTIFLSIDKKIVGQKADLFLYLPALGQVKQLITTSERQGSFAGSNLQFDQIGRSELHTDFNAELIGEETIIGLMVNREKQDRKAFVLHLTANPQTNPDESFPDRKIWVDEQEFFTLKSENMNTVGKLQNVMELDNLVTFKERLEANTIKVTNVLDNSSTTITITEREDVGELPDSIFVPENLPQFDPLQFNDKLQTKLSDPVCP
jgi:hypothetical protein